MTPPKVASEKPASAFAVEAAAELRDQLLRRSTSIGADPGEVAPFAPLDEALERSMESGHR
jgi:hypothetical protein